MKSLTIQLEDDTVDVLAGIAKATNRPQADIAAEAVASYAQHEAQIIASIRQGMAEAAAGRTVSHEDAMNRFRKTARGE